MRTLHSPLQKTSELRLVAITVTLGDGLSIGISRGDWWLGDCDWVCNWLRLSDSVGVRLGDCDCVSLRHSDGGRDCLGDSGSECGRVRLGDRGSECGRVWLGDRGSDSGRNCLGDSGSECGRIWLGDSGSVCGSIRLGDCRSVCHWLRHSRGLAVVVVTGSWRCNSDRGKVANNQSGDRELHCCIRN